MRVDIESSDVKYNAFYRDERCEELEGILKDDPKFRECKVERQHFDDENLDNDPYIIMDAEGKEIFMLEKWQSDALNPSELLSYMNVQNRRDLCVDRVERAAVNLAGASIALMSFLVPISFAVIASSLIPYFGGMILIAVSVLIISIILYYLKHKQSNAKKREVDLIAARTDPSFLEALRKLAAVPKSAYDYVYNEEHIERLEYIESVANGTD